MVGCLWKWIFWGLVYINDKIECMFTVDVENGLEGSYFLSKTHIFSFPISFSYFQKGQPWDFFGRNDAKAETPVLWPPHGKSWLIGKDSDAGRDWGQEKKGTTEDEMAGWHHWLNGRESDGSLWWTGRPGVLRFMASQRVGHNWATELNWTWTKGGKMSRNQGWFILPRNSDENEHFL